MYDICIYVLFICIEMCTPLSSAVLLTNQDNETIPEGSSVAPAPADVLTLDTSAARHGSSISPPPSEDLGPVQKKLRLDIDTIRDGGSTSPLPSERSKKLPFGCGCGKCTFFSFIESGCPTPISSASSFPYLDLSGLTHEQQQELRGRLRTESQKIMIRFQKLVSSTIKSFKKQCVPLDDLVAHVMALGAFDPVFKEPQVPVFRYYFKELKAADTIPKVFIVLNDYFSFFNYHIIQHIIEELGTEEDKAGLQSYKKEFNEYAKRRVFESLPEFGPVSDADHADIFMKVDAQYENFTAAQIEDFRHKLSEILHLSSQGILRLCRVDKGCFRLMFQVPLFVQQEIFPLSRRQESSLKAKGVIELTCGLYHFLDSAEKFKRYIDARGTFILVANLIIFIMHINCMSASQLMKQRIFSHHKRNHGLILTQNMMVSAWFLTCQLLP